MGLRDCKETDVLQLICSVSLIAKTTGILKDEGDDDSSNSEFSLRAIRKQLCGCFFERVADRLGRYKAL